MRVLQVHNEYRVYGGEDVVLDLEFDLLRSRGHHVEQFVMSNKAVTKASLRVGFETVWSRRSNKKLLRKLEEMRPDLMHVHNTFTQLSPSVYWAAAAAGVPVVQTLHNYRLTCANALLMRDGGPCELCVGRVPLPALRYKCYRGSLAATGAVVGMQVAHRALGTWTNKVDAYIVLAEFAKSLMIRSGLPPELVHVKPHFILDPLHSLAGPPKRKDQIVFVGRLAPEKGVDILLEAWKRLGATNFRLVIVGDGPERADLERRFAGLPGVVWRGWVDREDVLREVARSRGLVMASRWYEVFGVVVVEALASGTPVTAPNHGAFPEMIVPGETGFLFRPGDPEDLAERLSTIVELEVGEWQRLSEQARETYLKEYTPEVGYERLMRVYGEAIDHARSRER